MKQYKFFSNLICHNLMFNIGQHSGVLNEAKYHLGKVKTQANAAVSPEIFGGEFPERFAGALPCALA